MNYTYDYDNTKNMLLTPVKIYVSKEMKKSVYEDAERFNIKKKDKPDVNLYINLLFKNYLSSYKSILEEYKKNIYSSLDFYQIDISEDIKEQLTNRIVISYFSKPYTYTKDKKANLNITFSKDIINEIASFKASIYANCDLSSFFNSIIAYFLKQPIYLREQYLELKNYEIINKCIKAKNKVIYSKKGDTKSHVFKPCLILYSNNEYYNYLIGEQDSEHHYLTSIRLSNIDSVTPCSEHFTSFSLNFFERLEIMKENGVQFPIDEIKQFNLTLTKEGYEVFKKMYLEKPRVLNIKENEDNVILTLDCSSKQREVFFEPFKGCVVDDAD